MVERVEDIHTYQHTPIYKLFREIEMMIDKYYVTVYNLSQKETQSCSSGTVWESWLSNMTKQKEREEESERG